MSDVASMSRPPFAPPPWLRLLAWALYDLANTFFAVSMLSFYFPLWLVEDRGAKELLFSVVLSGSMACVALLLPLCGAIADATNQRMRYLRWTTLGCVAATFAIGFVDGIGPALALFVLANICYQLGTVFYDALLWQLARPSTLSQASGFGAAFGYLGSMTGLALLWPFVRRWGHQAAFAPAAVFFLIFALPIFFVIREPASVQRIDWPDLVRRAVRRLNLTVRTVGQYRPLARFYLASFFSLNAINTVLVFMGVYTKKVLGFGEEELVRFFLLGQASAIAGSLAFGRVSEWIGAKRTLAIIWSGWLVALVLLALVHRQARWVWAIGPLFGVCLGSTWATARVLVVELAPKAQLAEFLGFAGLLGRSAGILGPLLWGWLVLGPGGYRQAILALIALLAVGLWIFRRVPEPRSLPTTLRPPDASLT